MTQYETKKIQRGTQKGLRTRVSQLRKEGWEKVGTEFSMTESGPGYRRSIHAQEMRRIKVEVVE